MRQDKDLKSRPLPETLQHLIDAYPDGSALIDGDGVILGVNLVWRTFSRDNGGGSDAHFVGENYLDVCRRSAALGSAHAAEILAGVTAVLNGQPEFRIDYDCHSPTEQRWYALVARPLRLEDGVGALILHRDVTAEVLRQNEARDAELTAQNYAAIVSTMPDPVIGFDLDGRITSWNAAAEKLYGYTRAEIVGQSMEVLYPPDSPKTVQDYLSDILDKGIRHYEAVRRTRSGRQRTIEVSAAPVLSSTGEVIGVSNVHRDLTEQRQAAVRHKRVLDNLFSFVGLLDLDGTLLDANHAPLEAAGLTASEVLNRKFWNTYWWNHSREVQDRLKAAIAQAREGELVRYDVPVRIAGGRLIWIDFQIAPLRDTDGQITQLIPSGIDVSDRKALTEALHASNETFRNLVEHSPQGIHIVDADFRIAHVSDGAQKAFENVRPLIGRDFAEATRIMWSEPFATEMIERFRHTLAIGEPYHSPRSIELRRDTGQVESYDWTIERITMPDGRPGVVCNFYDLSERQQYEEHIGLLMREVNHRAKNLLTVVMSIARQTARDCTPEEFLDRFSRRLLGLAASQDLIVQGNWGGVTMSALVNSQLRNLGHEVSESRFETDGPPMMLAPSAAQGIGMALHELGTNAIKYGALSVPDGIVAIRWGVSEDGRDYHIRWQERGGPVVQQPDRSGFGRIVIEQMAAISVGGRVELDYAPEGLVRMLEAPVERVAGGPGGAQLAVWGAKG